MKSRFLIIVFVILIGVGSYLVSGFYHDVIYQLDLSMAHLKAIENTSDPEVLLDSLYLVKEYLPKQGNPVWIYPTQTTDFTRMQTDLDTMIASAQKISAVPYDTSAFHTAILEIHDRSNMLNENLKGTIPYLYASIANLLFNLIWLLGILGLHDTLMKRPYQS